MFFHGDIIFSMYFATLLFCPVIRGRHVSTKEQLLQLELYCGRGVTPLVIRSCSLLEVVIVSWRKDWSKAISTRRFFLP